MVCCAYIKTQSAKFEKSRLPVTTKMLREFHSVFRESFVQHYLFIISFGKQTNKQNKNTGRMTAFSRKVSAILSPPLFPFHKQKRLPYLITFDDKAFVVGRRLLSDVTFYTKAKMRTT